MYLLTNFQKDAGNTGILTDGLIFHIRNFIILYDPLQNLPGTGPFFQFQTGTNTIFHILRQMAICLDTQPSHGFRDLLGR